MTDKIEEIRARHALYPPGSRSPSGYFEAHQDRAFLLAEVERLREALRDALDGLRYWVPQTSVGAVEKCRIMEKGIEALEVKSAVERCRFMENGIEALEVNP